jgi:type I restriction enzyme S subunit
MTLRRVRVGEVLKLERREVRIDPLQEYQLVGVYSFGKGIFHRPPTVGSELGDYHFYAIRPDDLVLSNIQAWEGAIAHATAIDEGMIGTHRFLTYVPIGDQIDTNWARYFFLSRAGFPLIQKAAPGTVKRNRTLAIDRFEALELRLPDIDDQRRVAAELDRIGISADRVSNLAKQNVKIQGALISSLAHRHDLREDAKYRAGWKRVPLGHILELNVDRVLVRASDSYGIAGVYSFGRGLFHRGAMSGDSTAYRELHRLRRHQIVLSRLKAWEGALALVSTEFDGTHVSPEFPTFAVRTEMADPAFVGSLVTSEMFWRGMGRASKGLGARRERVGSSRFLESEIWLPPLDAQRAIVRRVRKLAAANADRQRVIELASAFKAASLNRAFAGLL